MDRSDVSEAGSRLHGGIPFPEGEQEDSAGRSLMEQLLADPSHAYQTLKYGDVIEGTVMRVDHDELLVDIGSKSEGVIPAREFSSLPDDERKNINVGDKMLVFVVQPENQEGHAVVSIDRARQEKSWRILQEQYERGEVIGAEVVNYNKGGLLVNLDGVRGFVPASQVTEIRGGDDAQKQADMARLIGSRLQLKIIEINRHRNRLILSERQALQERRDVMKEKLIEELREGEVRKGRVSSICDFGAFVDVGGADGLVHLSELSWSRVRHPSEVLSIGQEVEVFVLGINAEEKKIALSIKRTQAEPWSRVAANYDVNQLVIGTVTQLANFGAFARIEDGIEGLVHVSELSDARISHPRQLVHEGQELVLRIIRIDPQRRRMGLSLRRALEATDEEVEIALGQDAVELKHRLLELEVEPDPNADEEFERRERAENAERSERADAPAAVDATPAAAADDAANPENISADTAPTGASQAPDEGGFGETVGAMASAMADAMGAAAGKVSDLASAVADRVGGDTDEQAPAMSETADATAADATTEPEETEPKAKTSRSRAKAEAESAEVPAEEDAIAAAETAPVATSDETVATSNTNNTESVSDAELPSIAAADTDADGAAKEPAS
jgi:small subunit ribosomal protein S1